MGGLFGHSKAKPADPPPVVATPDPLAPGAMAEKQWEEARLSKLRDGVGQTDLMDDGENDANSHQAAPTTPAAPQAPQGAQTPTSNYYDRNTPKYLANGQRNPDYSAGRARSVGTLGGFTNGWSGLPPTATGGGAVAGVPPRRGGVPTLGGGTKLADNQPAPRRNNRTWTGF